MVCSDILKAISPTLGRSAKLLPVRVAQCAPTETVDTVRLVCAAGSMKLSSVRSSVCPIDRQQQRRASGLLLSSPADRRYRSTARRRSAANTCSVMLTAELTRLDRDLLKLRYVVCTYVVCTVFVEIILGPPVVEMTFSGEVWLKVAISDTYECLDDIHTALV